jgi:hypothetical protein
MCVEPARRVGSVGHRQHALISFLMRSSYYRVLTTGGLSPDFGFLSETCRLQAAIAGILQFNFLPHRSLK